MQKTSCDYAFDSGRHHTINQFHKVLNELLEENTKVHPASLQNSSDYFRHVGQQDILLKLLGVLSEMIASPH